MFTYASYLRQHISTLLIGVVCACAILWMSVIFGVSRDGVLFFAVIMAAGMLLASLIQYFRKKRFYQELEDAMQSLMRAIYLPELVDEPDFVEGAIAYEALEKMGSLYGAEISQIQLEAQDYRDFVELWIHEIKTPLAASKLILSRLHGPEADKLAHELERIDNLVEQALYYARSTSVANDYTLSEVNLSEIVNTACKKSLHFLIGNGTSVDNRIDPKLNVITDKPWAVFMVGQMIVNASKYGASSIVFRSTEKDAGTPRECTLLEIVDDGIGIPEADIARVFDRAFTGSNARMQGGSTGYGLYLVALMAERLGLGVGISSEEGKGTCAMMSFPHDRRRKS